MDENMTKAGVKRAPKEDRSQITQTKKKSNNYFDNAEAERLILLYQKNGCNDGLLLNKIMSHLDKIVIAIINKYQYYRYYDYDDLFQEGRMACFDSLKRFDVAKAPQPSKSVFSYFSHVVKRNLRFYTINKNRKLSRERQCDAEMMKKDCVFADKYEANEFFDGRIEIEHFFEKVKKLFVDKKRMLALAVIFEKYAREMSGTEFDAKDFIMFGKSYGYTPEYQKKFLDIIKQNREYLFGGGHESKTMKEKEAANGKIFGRKNRTRENDDCHHGGRGVEVRRRQR